VPFPSGRQHELRRGDQRAVAVEVGGGIRSYSVAGFDVLDGYGEEEMCSGARGTPLVPWPNRLRDGHYEFGGRAHQLPLTEPDRHNALHGLCRWTSWTCTKKAAERVVLETVVHPQPGYEFSLGVTAAYRLGPRGLEVTLTGRNLGREPLPFGAGQHPYVRVAEGPIDTAVLRSPARSRQVVDRRLLPTGEVRPVAGKYDFRKPRPIGRTILDVPLLDLERDHRGLAGVVLEGPERRVTLWLDEGFPFLMLFTGDTLAPAERRRGLGVEPMTCAPDAFNSGLGLRVLQPGETCAARWGISVEARS
jgi:aldose 1-epimerase